MDKTEAYQKLKEFNDIYLPFSGFIAANEAITELLEMYRANELVERLIIVGESGAGKSSLCELFEKRNPKIELSDRDKVPVLNVRIPANATIGGMAQAILFKLGDPYPNAGTHVGKKHRILTLCRNCGVEIILLDEGQHLYDRGKQKSHYYVGDWIKELTDELKIPVVILGLVNLKNFVQTNEQLRRRFSRFITLKLGFGNEVEPDKEILQVFLSLIKCLPVEFSIEQYSWPDLTQRLYYASECLIGYIKNLLYAALKVVLDNDDTVMTPMHLELSFTSAIWNNGIGPLNPFSHEFEFRHLNRSGEPFGPPIY